MEMQRSNNNNQKTNVIYVVSSLYIAGAENVIANLCRFLDKKQFNISVVCLKHTGSLGEILEKEGYEVIALQANQSTKANYFSFLKLLRLIGAKEVDIVHSHDLHGLIDSSLCKLLKPRIKLLHTFHYGNYPYITKKYLLLEKLFSKLPDMLIAVGEHQKKAIQNTFGLRNDRILTILNGIDVTTKAETKSTDTNSEIIQQYKRQGKLVIGSIGTLIEQKGMEDLISVAIRLSEKRSDFVVLVVGEGYLRPALEAQAHSLGLEDTVIFVGWVDDAATKLLGSFDIFLQTSRWEAMSIVILEAMAQSRPIVATDVGENSLVIDDGINGHITQPRDISAMVDKLESLLDDDVQRQTLGAKAFDKYRNNYTAEIMAKNHKKQYLKLIN